MVCLMNICINTLHKGDDDDDDDDYNNSSNNNNNNKLHRHPIEQRVYIYIAWRKYDINNQVFVWRNTAYMIIIIIVYAVFLVE